MNDSERIKEINQYIKKGLEQWRNVCLMADADQWAYMLDYDAYDVLSVTMLFMHVCSNIGIKKQIIREKESVECGNKIRELVKFMTGYDTHEVSKLLERKDNEGRSN